MAKNQSQQSGQGQAAPPPPPPAQNQGEKKASSETDKPSEKDQRTSASIERAKSEELQKMAERATTAEAKTQAALGEIQKLSEALEHANKENQSLLRKVADLEADLRRKGAPTIRNLPAKSVQLSESVKITNVEAGKGAIDAKPGDVLVAGDPQAVAKIRAQLGTKARVFPVTEAELKEIVQSGLCAE